MIRILFICHGNICRSPMAEFILKKKVEDLGKTDDFYISSAATSTEEIWGEVGNPIYPRAKEKLKEHGIFCEGKRAIQLKKSDYENYDFLIGMDDMNIRNIERITGHGRDDGKIYKLLFFAGSMESVSDPWYSGDFDRAYQDIERGCEGLLNYLNQT